MRKEWEWEIARYSGTGCHERTLIWRLGRCTVDVCQLPASVSEHSCIKYMNVAPGKKTWKTFGAFASVERSFHLGRSLSRWVRFLVHELNPRTRFCWNTAESVGQSLFQMMVSLTSPDTSNKIMCQGNWKALPLGWQVEQAAWIFMRINWPFSSWMLIRNKWDQSFPHCFSYRTLFQNTVLLMLFEQMLFLFSLLFNLWSKWENIQAFDFMTKLKFLAIWDFRTGHTSELLCTSLAAAGEELEILLCADAVV